MLIAVAALMILSIVGLIAAVINGNPAPGYPRHGTFGISGLDSSFIAWSCVGMCALGLVLLFIDSRLARRRPAEPEEQGHTAGDELFGQSDVQRELQREEHG